MSALASTIIGSLADTQGTRDARRIAIDKVGVRDVVYPVRILSRSGKKQSTVAHFDMYVNLRHDRKGTHMSRFLEILHRQDQEITVRTFQGMAREMVGRLEADAGYLAMRFPYFIDKTAPVSGARSLLNYEIALKEEFDAGASRTQIKVAVPITSLCPCSKDIADYGAHSQRACVTLDVRIDHFMWVEELIDLTEARASSELYGLLKRPDEKYVTERAYDNPKFVEDIVRDIAADLNAEPRILAYSVECENFESIHNHSAYARIDRDKQTRAAGPTPGAHPGIG